VTELDAGPLATAGERAAGDAAPVDDATGSADYKAQLVKVLVGRTVRQAIA
jgi:CO/xanthine dehydrogenase FAD-binding subunit